MGQRRGPLGVVQCGRDEDEPREDERDRGKAQRERGGDAQRVVDARPDVAVARREQCGWAERARELGGAADHDTQIPRPPPAPVDRVRAHRSRG